MPRVYCDGCGRPPIVCICSSLVTVRPKTKVVVLQHPREADNPIGTAWMVEKCLGAERIVGVDLGNDPGFVAAVSAPNAILLAPGPSAIDLHASPPKGPVTLIVVDGTWSQATKLFRSNPGLAAIPRYAFQPAKPSNYRIRREPADHCVSTIEATVAALACLEPESQVERVLAGFDAMVDHQLRIAREQSHSRHLLAAIARGKKPSSRTRRIPLDRSSLVVAYGEANAWPRGSEHGPHPEIVHLVAERLVTGERFEAYIAPERPLSPGFPLHTGLGVGDVHGGEPRAQFRERFAAFMRESDLLAMWGFYAMNLLRVEGLTLPPVVDLRSTAMRYLGRRAGDVAEMAAALGCAVEPPWARGRTGTRHAAAVSVARALSQ